jgi:hypothetical protein
LWAHTRILKKCATTIFKVDKIISSGGGRQVNYRGGFQGNVAKPWDWKGQVNRNNEMTKFRKSK